MFSLCWSEIRAGTSSSTSKDEQVNTEAACEVQSYLWCGWCGGVGGKTHFRLWAHICLSLCWACQIVSAWSHTLSWSRQQLTLTACASELNLSSPTPPTSCCDTSSCECVFVLYMSVCVRQRERDGSGVTLWVKKKKKASNRIWATVHRNMLTLKGPVQSYL